MKSKEKNYYPGEYLIPVAKKFLSEHEPTEDVQVLSDYAKRNGSLPKSFVRRF